MELVDIRDLFHHQEDYVGKKITVGGWVRSNRNSKNFGFIVVNDGTFFEPLQVVYADGLENFQELTKINVGAAIVVTGVLEATPEAKQPFEIQAEEIIIEGASAPDYPLQKKRHSFEYLRTISHLRPRTNTFEAVFRVRSLIAYAIHKFFQERDFVYVHTPLITGSDCEGAGEMFQVTTMDLNNIPHKEDGSIDYTQDFFGKPTNLTVSGQLNGETFALAFKNIYTFGPTFRAENSNTTRHAAEFWMIEPEIAFADLEDDMVLAESMLKYIISYVMEHAPEEMQFFNSFVDKGLIERLNNVLHSDFARVTYTEAIELLEKNNDKFDYKVSWGCDLQTEHERFLTEQVFKRPVYGFSCGFGFKVIEIELCCQKKFVPCNTAFPDGIAYVFFISIGFSGINKAIACMDCREHAFFALLRIRDLKGAKSDHGHFHAVVQLNIFHKIAPFCS